MRTCAKREVSSIDAPPKPKVDVQETIANAKVYCKEHPESFVSLRDYSGGIYNETCAAFAAEQHVTDPTYKIGSDRPAQDRLRKPGGQWAHGAVVSRRRLPSARSRVQDSCLMCFEREPPFALGQG